MCVARFLYYGSNKYYASILPMTTSAVDVSVSVNTGGLLASKVMVVFTLGVFVLVSFIIFVVLCLLKIILCDNRLVGGHGS